MDGSSGGRRATPGIPTQFAGTGSAAAFQRLADLGENGEKILLREVTHEKAISLFATGRTPFLVCYARAVGVSREAGVRVGVSDVPPFTGGQPARSLVAVHGFYFPTTGANKVIARDLVLDYLTRIDVAEALYQMEPRPPMLVAAAEKLDEQDGSTAVYRDQFQRGELIPSNPDVEHVWKAFHRAEVDAIAGVPVDTVVLELARSINALNQP